jgi:hypothetical protein
MLLVIHTSYCCQYNGIRKNSIAENKILTFKQFTGAASVLAIPIVLFIALYPSRLFWLETTKVQLHEVAVKVIKSDAVCPPTAHYP